MIVAAVSIKKNAAPLDRPARLLDWYDRHRRRLPWRALPGEAVDPYRVWLSEIMLQQTNVKTVAPYFAAFVTRWPNVGTLAAADRDDVLKLWAGLGYYSRARNLHACAIAVAHEHGGNFPDSEDGLRTLPGVGPYTAAAIAAIAFDRPAIVVDGNIERVTTRVFAIDTPLPAARPEIRTRAASLTPAERPGDYAQAVMDLGSGVCTPRSPACPHCPWNDGCRAFAQGNPERYPIKAPKAARPTRYGVAYWIEAEGHVLLTRRPPKGLLGGMRAFPTSPWGGEAVSADIDAPVAADWTPALTPVRHGFTHFELILTVVRTSFPARPDIDGEWVAVEALATAGLPTLFQKVADAALTRTLL